MKIATYGDWDIYYDPPPIPDRSYDYSFMHKNLDGPGDNRYGYGESIHDCIQTIKYTFEDEGKLTIIKGGEND